MTETKRGEETVRRDIGRRARIALEAGVRYLDLVAPEAQEAKELLRIGDKNFLVVSGVRSQGGSFAQVSIDFFMQRPKDDVIRLAPEGTLALKTHGEGETVHFREITDEQIARAQTALNASLIWRKRDVDTNLRLLATYTRELLLLGDGGLFMSRVFARNDNPDQTWGHLLFVGVLPLVEGKARDRLQTLRNSGWDFKNEKLKHQVEETLQISNG